MTFTDEDVRNLPLPDLSLKLLESTRGAPNFNTLVQGFEQRARDRQPSDLPAMLDRLSDAWAWLQAHALIGPLPKDPRSGWMRVTAAGRDALQDPSSVA
jgi:hypothetical protein